jgi:hypothetical protein
MTGSTSLDKALKQLVSAQSTILLSTCINEDRERLRQRYAYLAFVFTAGQGMAVDWFANADECKWQGVTCNGGRISLLKLYNQGLSGSIPVDVGLLYDMTYFRVYTNGLGGSLPSSIGNWTGLTYINIGSNSLVGSLPFSIGKWTGLKSFYASDNQLVGALPSSIGTWKSLNNFYVSSNRFTGTVPTTISSWTAIQQAHFEFNSFHGTLPPVGNSFCPQKPSTFGEMYADCRPTAISPPEIICTCCSHCCDDSICYFQRS